MVKVEQLRKEAAKHNIKGRSKMNKAQLCSALAEVGVKFENCTKGARQTKTGSPRKRSPSPKKKTKAKKTKAKKMDLDEMVRDFQVNGERWTKTKMKKTIAISSEDTDVVVFNNVESDDFVISYLPLDGLTFQAVWDIIEYKLNFDGEIFDYLEFVPVYKGKIAKALKNLKLEDKRIIQYNIYYG